jgi:hypothetical protein
VASLHLLVFLAAEHFLLAGCNGFFRIDLLLRFVHDVCKRIEGAGRIRGRSTVGRTGFSVFRHPHTLRAYWRRISGQDRNKAGDKNSSENGREAFLVSSHWNVPRAMRKE